MAELDQYLSHKAKVLAARREHFATNPKDSKVTLQATSHVAGNTGVRPVTMGDHVIISDSAPGLAGHSLGPSSPEMVLGALASCLVHTYLLQAALLDIALDQVEVEIRGALDMAPVVGLGGEQEISLQDMTYQTKIASPADAGVLADLHNAVERTCAVLNTLRNPQEIRRIDV